MSVNSYELIKEQREETGKGKKNMMKSKIKKKGMLR